MLRAEAMQSTRVDDSPETRLNCPKTAWRSRQSARGVLSRRHLEYRSYLWESNPDWPLSSRLGHPNQAHRSLIPRRRWRNLGDARETYVTDWKSKWSSYLLSFARQPARLNAREVFARASDLAAGLSWLTRRGSVRNETNVVAHIQSERRGRAIFRPSIGSNRIMKRESWMYGGRLYFYCDPRSIYSLFCWGQYHWYEV